MDCTITHNGINKSVTFPVYDEGGTPLFSIDKGYPELNIYESGELNARFGDFKSVIETYTITARLKGSSGYSDALTLADIIKSRQGSGEELTVEVSGVNLDAYPTTPTTVAPAAGQDSALSLTYPPGTRDVVEIELSLTRVQEVRGTANQEATTPTATGTGPVVISNGTDSVELFEDIAVSRELGRPNSATRTTTRDYPSYIDHRKTAADRFDIRLQLYRSGPSKALTLANDVFKPSLGRTPLTLDFQGQYGMGEFKVVPDGSQALRFQRIAGQKDIENIPTISLRRVADL